MGNPIMRAGWLLVRTIWTRDKMKKSSGCCCMTNEKTIRQWPSAKSNVIVHQFLFFLLGKLNEHVILIREGKGQIDWSIDAILIMESSWRHGIKIVCSWRMTWVCACGVNSDRRDIRTRWINLRIGHRDWNSDLDDGIFFATSLLEFVQAQNPSLPPVVCQTGFCVCFLSLSLSLLLAWFEMFFKSCWKCRIDFGILLNWEAFFSIDSLLSSLALS